MSQMRYERGGGGQLWTKRMMMKLMVPIPQLLEKRP